MNYKRFVSSEEAQTILILHGWRWSSDSWGQVWKLLQQQWYNVIVPDIPCSSTKTVCKREFTLEKYAELIEEFCRVLELESIILWGHSNGGATSIVLENRKNISIAWLVLNNSAGIRHDKKRSLKRKILNYFTKTVKNTVGTTDLLSLPIMKKMRQLFYKCIWWQDYLEAEKNEFLHKTYLNMINTDLSLEIADISTETLLIWGEKDTYTPVWDCNTMNSLISGSRKIILANETHGIHLKSPDKLVQTFLSSV